MDLEKYDLHFATRLACTAMSQRQQELGFGGGQSQHLGNEESRNLLDPTCSRKAVGEWQAIRGPSQLHQLLDILFLGRH